MNWTPVRVPGGMTRVPWPGFVQYLFVNFYQFVGREEEGDKNARNDGGFNVPDDTVGDGGSPKAEVYKEGLVRWPRVGKYD